MVGDWSLGLGVVFIWLRQNHSAMAFTPRLELVFRSRTAHRTQYEDEFVATGRAPW
jgi:hypothetical protein